MLKRNDVKSRNYEPKTKLFANFIFEKMISYIYRYPSAQIVDHVHEVGDHTDGRIQVGGRIQTCDHQTILRRALCSDH